MSKLKRKNPSWWDELQVPADIRSAHLFSWLEDQAPLPEEHDYVLSTDGSGCVNGWGASASIIQKVNPGGELGRELDKYQPIISATYGSTVQRREFSALLDGLHEILRLEIETMPERELEEGESELKRLLYFTNDNRITVLWYTDRSNLAKSLLYDEYNEVLNKRNSESDLWMRYAAMSRYFCITPMWTDRNTIPAQKMCDKLCDIARRTLMQAATQITTETAHTLHDSWNKKRPQKANF